MSYTFTHFDADTGFSVVITCDPITHFEITDAYVAFLRACGFILPNQEYGDELDIALILKDAMKTKNPDKKKDKPKKKGKMPC